MLGLHIDLSWVSFREEYLEGVIKRAVQLGVDTILLDTLNKIPIDWMSRALHPDAWSKRQLNHFLKLCAANNLTVIPLINLMGHLNWLLQWPWWSHLQEDFHTVCPSHPEIPGLLSRFVDDTLKLFPDAPYIHIGGDEGTIGICSRCKATGKPAGELYLQHHLPLIKQIEAAGKRVILYNDILCGNGYPEILEKLPGSVIICVWDYSSGNKQKRRTIWGLGEIQTADELLDLPAHLRPLRKYFTTEDGSLTEFPYADICRDHGFEVIIMSSARCGHPQGENYCAPRTLNHVHNCLAAARKTRQLDLKGLIISSWATRCNHLETNWPSFAAGAWGFRDPQLQYEQISERFANDFFGLDCPGLFDIFDRLSPSLPDLCPGMKAKNVPDVVYKWLEWMYRDPQSEECQQAIKELPQVKQSYKSGYEELLEMSDQVENNHLMYQHWRLAGKTLLHKASALPEMIKTSQGITVNCQIRNNLVAEIDELIREHQNLFGKTMPASSLDQEIRLRFEEARELFTR